VPGGVAKSSSAMMSRRSIVSPVFAFREIDARSDVTGIVWRAVENCRASGRPMSQKRRDMVAGDINRGLWVVPSAEADLFVPGGLGLQGEQQIPHRAFGPVRNDRGRLVPAVKCWVPMSGKSRFLTGPSALFGMTAGILVPAVKCWVALGWEQQIPHWAFGPVRNDRGEIDSGRDVLRCS